MALFKLITPPLQDFGRIDGLLGLCPALKELVHFNGDRWVSSGLEEAARDSVASAALANQPSSPNLLRTLADKLPSSVVSLRVSADDVPAVSPSEKSALASEYWSGVWAARPPVTKGQRDIFLRGYDKKVDPSLCTRPDLAFITEIIDRPNDSTPGPDGIPFAAWRAASGLSGPILLRVFEAVAKGHFPPEGFNYGLLFLLPKKDTGLVSDTRPLSVTNTDNRILAAAVARGIMPAVSAYVDPSQKGFLAGKDSG